MIISSSSSSTSIVIIIIIIMIIIVMSIVIIARAGRFRERRKATLHALRTSLSPSRPPPLSIRAPLSLSLSRSVSRSILKGRLSLKNKQVSRSIRNPGWRPAPRFV